MHFEYQNKTTRDRIRINDLTRGRTSSTHSFNPYASFGHLWSYFDFQNLRLVILYIFVISTKASKWITVFLFLLVLLPTISSL